MDISLREWLIIGGVLIVILILVDGWRRVSANRSRLRLEIDRTLSELAEDAPNNPELPNGGARVRDHEGQPSGAARVEPGFADDRVDAAASDQSLAGMDPLFDDIPAATGPGRNEAGRGASGRIMPDPIEPSPPLPRETVAEAPAQPREVELTVPTDPVSPELKALDLEQPIPVLFDEVNPQDAPELPDDTLAAYRQSIGAAEASSAEPEFRPEPNAELPSEAEPEAEVEAQVTSAQVQPEVETAIGSDESQPESPASAAPIEPVVEPRADSPAVAPRSRGLKSTPDPDQVLIITVVGRNGQHLPGPALDKIVTACGMEWGDMAIYHRPEDSSPDAPIQFSMANAVTPGTFDPKNLEALETPAVTFFMSLNEPSDAMTAYECMLATAETLAKHLDGDLLDEDRSVMRPQTKEHYRERIRDFEMHQRQRRAN